MTHNGLSPLPQDLTLAEMSDVQIRAIVGELIKTNRDLKEVNSKLSDAQSKLIQSEKLASIGQLAAGVAHEINNPIGFIFSNFGTLEQYLEDLFQMLDAYEQAEASVSDSAALARIRSLKADLDIDYLKEDIPNLMRESRDGIQRVRKIVQDLKDFSRVDARQEWESVDLHAGIDSTLNIVNNEIKYKADVVKHYGALPEVQCLPSELNQVFMNLLVNAAHAITAERGTITISTGVEGTNVWVEVADTGAGIDSTLNIVNNEIKYKADVVKHYGALPEVQCLPSELNQVFMNLLVNAAHAITAERGTITISTGVEGPNVWVEVADTGAGIAQENLKRIFDPFFTTKPVGKGTGLGLSLSYGIVQKHSGRMEVHSELGVGTRFKITLPLKHEEAATQPAA